MCLTLCGTVHIEHHFDLCLMPVSCAPIQTSCASGKGSSIKYAVMTLPEAEGNSKIRLAWHLAQECARYLETFKAYESKPADLIQGRAEEDYMSRLNAAITTVWAVCFLISCGRSVAS